MYSVFKYSQVTYNHTEPYHMAENFSDCTIESNVKVQEEKISPKEQAFHEEEASLKYEVIIENAKREAEKILEQAKREGQNLMSQKEKEGFEKGMILAGEKLDLEMDQMKQQQANLQRDFESKVKELEKSILHLSFVLAEKIIKTECEKDDQVIVRILDSIVNQYRDENHLTIEVSKNNAKKLEKVLTSDKIDIRCNDDFGNTDVQVISDTGVIDASVDVQFMNLKSALLKENVSYGV